MEHWLKFRLWLHTRWTAVLHKLRRALHWFVSKV